MPNASPAVVNRATPAWRATVATAAPSTRKVTVPVGVPPAAGVTTAVKVAGWPWVTASAADEETAVAVAIGSIVWTTGADVPPAKLPSPAYSAVTGWPPTASPATARVATPPASTAAVPSTTAPSRNVTVPVGTPAPGATAATVAVRVTGWE